MKLLCLVFLIGCGSGSSGDNQNTPSGPVVTVSVADAGPPRVTTWNQEGQDVCNSLCPTAGSVIFQHDEPGGDACQCYCASTPNEVAQYILTQADKDHLRILFDSICPPLVEPK